MKRFVTNCVLFSIPVVLTAVLLELAARSTDNTYKQKYAWMQKNASRVETLVMGSSHTYYGVRPRFLDGMAYNLANTSQDWEHDLELLRRWAAEYRRLKTVIVPVSASSWFTGGLKHGMESFRCRYYKIYMDCDLYPDLSQYSFELTNLKTARIKLATFFHDLIYPPPVATDSELGWDDGDSEPGKDTQQWKDGSEARKAVERHTAKTWDYTRQNYRYIKAIADLCLQQGARLVLITTPCWKSYYENLPEKQIRKMHALTQQLQREYDITYLDYMIDHRFTADDFHDSNHLSKQGAEKFTKLLNEDMKSVRTQAKVASK